MGCNMDAMRGSGFLKELLEELLGGKAPGRTDLN